MTTAGAPPRPPPNPGRPRPTRVVHRLEHRGAGPLGHPLGHLPGVTQAGLSADLITAGLGWVWATDCTGGQLVRFDVQTGEVTGRLNLGSCPSAIAIAFDLVWPALPSDGTIVTVDPESGAIVAEGTSGMDTPLFLAAGSLDVAGNEYYWRLDELPVSVGSGTV